MLKSDNLKLNILLKNSENSFKELQNKFNLITKKNIINEKTIVNLKNNCLTKIEMVCNDLRFHDMQNDTEYLLLKSVLKEQKKIQQQQEKRLTKISKNKLKFPKRREIPNKDSKFKEKYKDRVSSIKNSDAKIKENRKVAEQIERLRKSSIREINNDSQMPKRDAIEKNTRRKK